MNDHQLTEVAKIGYWGNDNPYARCTGPWYAHALGQLLHREGYAPPSAVRIGTGDRVFANGLQFEIVDEGAHSIRFERVFLPLASDLPQVEELGGMSP